MVASRTQDLLTAFSPSLGYFAISTGDGRIKIWDAVNGQLQTELSDIGSSKGMTGFFASNERKRGHLSLDYTCLAWLSLDRKNKNKLESTLLVLGTGSGDILAIDVSVGSLKWTFSDCHPGGTTAVSFSTLDSYVYTAGRDKMICKIEPQTGNLVQRFKGSSSIISAMTISPDGKTMAAASAQLKVFNCANNQKIQKFSGHAVAVGSISLSEDGRYVLSCAFGERYIVLWAVDGSKNGKSSCVFAMEHPAIYVECIGCEKELGFCILSISEIGECYAWRGRNIEELQGSNPAKISLYSEGQENGSSKILAAKLLGLSNSTEMQILVSYGLVVKPCFQRVTVQPGEDKKLHISRQGILIPAVHIKHEGGKVTALDHSNADGALLPTATIPNNSGRNIDYEPPCSDVEDYAMDVDNASVSMEQELKKLKVLDNVDGGVRFATFLNNEQECSSSLSKMRTTVSSMEPQYAFQVLKELIVVWQSRSRNNPRVLPWIHCILICHGDFILSQGKSECRMLDSLSKIAKSRLTATQQLLQLSGRLQLISAQISRGALSKDGGREAEEVNKDEEDDDRDDDLQRLYGRDDEEESELSSETD